jgi:hypothetical protein
MQADTGHLIRVQKGGQIPVGYDPIPEGLARAAEQKLNGNSEAYVSKASGGKLSKWASEKRKQKRKMAKKSRKQNR